MIKREIYLEQIRNLFGSDFIKVIVGLRRSGKTSLLKSIIEELKNRGIKDENIIYISFESVEYKNIFTSEQLDEAIKYTLYPPDGLRGFGPQRAVRYGLDSEMEYLKQANDALCRFVQIESPEGVENLPEMVKNKWVDAFIIGPCDLSCRAGCPGDIYGETVTNLICRASEIVRAAGKRLGLSIGAIQPEKMQHWRDLGLTMISTGNDYTFVLKGAQKNLELLRLL